jgi:hypothetical protein
MTIETRVRALEARAPRGTVYVAYETISGRIPDVDEQGIERGRYLVDDTRLTSEEYRAGPGRTTHRGAIPIFLSFVR